MPRLQLKRGNKANLPTSGMLAGEPHFTIDKGTLHVAIDATNKTAVTPSVADLATLPVIDPNDFVMLHDISEAAGQMEKKITFDNFKTALNIPAGSTDEKVAVVSGGTSGYVWGTDGSDGIFRMGSSMTWTKDAGNAFVTLDVNVVDGGTF